MNSAGRVYFPLPLLQKVFGPGLLTWTPGSNSYTSVMVVVAIYKDSELASKLCLFAVYITPELTICKIQHTILISVLRGTLLSAHHVGSCGISLVNITQDAWLGKKLANVAYSTPEAFW